MNEEMNIVLHVGEQRTLSLYAHSTAGYVWGAVVQGGCVSAETRVSSSQNPVRSPGTLTEWVCVIVGLCEGQATVRLKLARPWETGNHIEERVVTVSVV